MVTFDKFHQRHYRGSDVVICLNDNCLDTGQWLQPKYDIGAAAINAYSFY